MVWKRVIDIIVNICASLHVNTGCRVMSPSLPVDCVQFPCSHDTIAWMRKGILVPLVHWEETLKI